MDWIEIRHKYPKAWEEMRQHFNDGIGHVDLHEFWGLYWHGDTKELSHPIHIRELYDFYDERGIYVNISPEKVETMKWSTRFEWEIMGDVHNGWYGTRREAEEAALIGAFKILENQLK